MFILTNLFLNFKFHDDEFFTRSAKYFFFEIHCFKVPENLSGEYEMKCSKSIWNVDFVMWWPSYCYLKCPKIEQFHFRFLFCFNINSKCPMFFCSKFSESKRKNGTFKYFEHKNFGHLKCRISDKKYLINFKRKRTENEYVRFWGISNKNENATKWQKHFWRDFWGISFYLPYHFLKTTRFSSWKMINSDQRRVPFGCSILSQDVLKHYFINSLFLVSVTRSLSPFLVIVVTISVCHMIWGQLLETYESFDGSKNSKTGILDSGRVISVFRVISPDFKRWLHFGKLRVPSFFITKYHRSIKMIISSL